MISIFLNVAIILEVVSAWNISLHEYAVTADLHEDELIYLVKKEGGEVLGQIFGIYHVKLPKLLPTSESRAEHKIIKRDLHTSDVDSLWTHPKVRSIEYQVPLIASKSVPFLQSVYYTEGLGKKIAQQRQAEMQAEDEYTRRYRNYAEWIQQLVVFNDPASLHVWQYINSGLGISHQTGLDLDVYPAYYEGLSGLGITAVVLDDGLDTLHDDLKDNYSKEVSTNLDDPLNGDYSPHGPHKVMQPSETHGTRVAGLIGAVGENKFCTHGVAYNIKVGAVRLLNDVVTDIKEARSLTYNTANVDVYCSAWGPLDNARVLDKPQNLAWKALEYGLKNGRHGHGSIYIYASGNGGYSGDHCGADGFVSSPYSIAVTALDQDGLQPKYAESCSAVRLAIPTGGTVSSECPFADVLPSTDANNLCIATFTGTSASAPMAAGCIALVLEANPNLTSRDVEHMLPWATRIPAANSIDWQVNSAGILHSPRSGFGLPSCYAMTQFAKTWNAVGPWCISTASTGNAPLSNWAKYQNSMPNDTGFSEISNHEEAVAFASKLQNTEGRDILVDQTQYIPFNIKTSKGSLRYHGDGKEECHNQLVSKVAVRIQWTHMCRGSLAFYLQSPTGTRSLLLDYRPLDTYAGEGDIVITTVAHWGEEIDGEWIFSVDTKLPCNSYSPFLDEIRKPRGKIRYIELEFWGTSIKDGAFQRNLKLLQPLVTTIGQLAIKNKQGHWLTSTEIYHTYLEQRALALNRTLSVKKGVNRFLKSGR